MEPTAAKPGPRKKAAAMTVERAQALFGGGLCCSESVLLALAERYAMTSPLLPRIASGLCAGMAYSSSSCGALTGAVLAVGLVLGRDAPGDDRGPCDEAVGELLRRFEQAHGSDNCRVLTGVDLATEQGQRAFEQQGRRRVCEAVVETAVGLVCELCDAAAKR
jgi:C_GCAxxG_C_C family probable redox protein